MTDLKKAFDAACRASEERGVIDGLLGKPDGSGGYTVPVANRPGWVYVRTGTLQNQTVMKALNLGTSNTASRPVRLKPLSQQGDYYVVGSNPAMIEAFMNGASYMGDVSSHTHQIGTGLEYMIEAQRIEPGLVSYVSALTIQVRGFRYFYANAWRTFTTDTIDLTAYKPSTVGYWAWVLVGVNPATNAIVAVTGTEYAQSVDLTNDLIDDIPFGEYIPCAALKVKTSDLNLWSSSKYTDARGWFNAPSTYNTLLGSVMTDADGNVMIDADGNMMIEA